MSRYLLIAIGLISLISAFIAVAKQPQKIVFTEQSIGSLALVEKMDISLYRIKNAFPYYRVTQEIAHGDSPDFHRFTVANRKGEVLIEFISYIKGNDQASYEQAVVKLDEVISCSKLITANSGISPSDPIDKIYQARPTLRYGYGHFDNYLGQGKLWYLFRVPNDIYFQASEEKAKAVNPSIDCISWPYARWR